LQDMKNDAVVPAIIGVVRAKPEFLDLGIDTLRNRASATPKSFIDDTGVLAQNVLDKIDAIFEELRKQNDVSAVKAIAVIAINHPEHADSAIQALNQMLPEERDTYRGVEGAHTLDGLSLDDIKDTIREHGDLSSEMKEILFNAGISDEVLPRKPDSGQDADGLDI